MEPSPLWIPIIALLIVPVTALGIPLVRAHIRRADRENAPASQLPSDLSARLDRMEQAIDSIAIEMERVSEGQRFAYKLLADRIAGGQISAPDKHSSERV